MYDAIKADKTTVSCNHTWKRNLSDKTKKNHPTHSIFRISDNHLIAEVSIYYQVFVIRTTRNTYTQIMKNEVN